VTPGLSDEAIADTVYGSNLHSLTELAAKAGHVHVNGASDVSRIRGPYSLEQHRTSKDDTLPESSKESILDASKVNGAAIYSGIVH
jgi:hypothetical protein